MSQVVLGAASRLSLGAAANALTEVTGVATGVDSIGHSRSRDTREIPGGRGAMNTQLGKYATHDFSLSADSNSIHDPIFRRLNGQRVYFEWAPSGKKAGHEKHTGSGIATCSLTLDDNTDACRWNVSIMVDGNPVKATF